MLLVGIVGEISSEFFPDRLVGSRCSVSPLTRCDGGSVESVKGSSDLTSPGNDHRCLSCSINESTESGGGKWVGRGALISCSSRSTRASSCSGSNTRFNSPPSSSPGIFESTSLGSGTASTDAFSSPSNVCLQREQRKAGVV